MTCDKCSKNQATVHLTQVINGEKVERHLCDECARVEGSVYLQPEWGVFNLLNTFMGLGSQPNIRVTNSKSLICHNCGTNWSEVQKSGLLGCSKCYEAFTKPLEAVINKVQFGTNHVGKVLKRRGGKINLKKKVSGLREKMQMAIAKEEFELAAEIRDKIKILEKQLEMEG